MNKTKYILAGFAIFASILMLSTTCIADPVQASISMEAVELAKQDVINSFYSLISKLMEDSYLKNLRDQLKNNRELSRISSAIEYAKDEATRVSYVNSYIITAKPIITNIAAYIDSTYSSDIKNIDAQYNEFADILLQYQSSNIQTEDEEILYAIPNPFALLLHLDDDSNEPISGDGFDGTYTDGEVNFIDDDSYTLLPSGSDEAQWVSFIRSINGSMYVPGYGWISQTDEYYDDWIAIENYLHGLPVSVVNAILEEFENTDMQPTCFLIIMAIIDAILIIIYYIAALFYLSIEWIGEVIVLILIEYILPALLNFLDIWLTIAIILIEIFERLWPF